ncbi:MAG: hypothetical protein A2045_02355 [Rhodocyclales bacterium GWA2_65_20]|nr:MAG: hypothetical protein A2045_02355 [Rhodocyclales bacterium GWA2_65_20]
MRRNVEFRSAQQSFVERGLASATKAKRTGNYVSAAAERAQAAIAKAVELLEIFPFSCRKAAGGPGTPFLRELIIPFGGAGYVALFEIEDNRHVTILAVRHQREEDYH